MTPRGKRRFLATFSSRLHATASRALLTQRYGGHRMSGNGWHGFAIGASLAETHSVQDAYTSVFQRVEELIRSDFSLTTSLRERLFIVHVKDSLHVDPVTELLMGDSRQPHEDVSGRYISGVKAAVISRPPDSTEFYESAAHETCHGICECLLDAVGSIPWSSEGYAEFVSLRVLRTLYPTGRYGTHVTTFRLFRKAGMDVSLRRLLGFEDQGRSMPSEYVGCFQSHAALLVRFLDDRAGEDDRIGKCYRAAVKENPPSCMQHILGLEEAFGKSIEEIEKDFHDFCSKL